MGKLLRPTRAEMKLWGKLDSPKVRRREGLFLAEGLKVTGEILKSSWQTRAILLREEKMVRRDGSLKGLPEDLPVYLLTEKEWRTLSQDREPEGIMALAAIPERFSVDHLFDPAVEVSMPECSKHLLLLHGIADPTNLGAVLRTAHWFGIGAVLLNTGSVDFTNPKVVRSSMGSLFHLRLVSEANFDALLPALKTHRTLIAGDVRQGVDPHPCRRGTAILLGSESHGLPPRLLETADERWHIGGFGGADSLSLPQAAAIMMYECTRGAVIKRNK